MINNNVILVADSCAGGCAVLRNLIHSVRGGRFVYLCDGEMNPFGLKTQTEIQNIVIDWLYYAHKINASVLVVACNTASVAIHPIRKKLELRFGIPIVSMLDAAQAAFSRNISLIEKKRISLYGTLYTISSHYLDYSLMKYHPQKF